MQHAAKGPLSVGRGVLRLERPRRFPYRRPTEARRRCHFYFPLPYITVLSAWTARPTVQEKACKIVATTSVRPYPKSLASKDLVWERPGHPRSTKWGATALVAIGPTPTMLRIEKVTDGRSTVLKLSGRIEEEYLAQLHSEIEKSGDVSKLDLRDVNLVDQSSVRFLIRCESQSIQLSNCPLYIKEWISRERHRAGSRTDTA